MKELIIKKTKNLIYIIRSLIRNYPTSKELSVLINSILDHENPTVKFMNEYVVGISKIETRLYFKFTFVGNWRIPSFL